MTYLLTQIAACMVIALVIGMLIGWLLRNTGAERRERDLQLRGKEQLALRDDQLATQADELTDAHGRTEELQGQLKESLAATHKLEQEIGAQIVTISQLEDKVDELQAAATSEAESARESRQSQLIWIEQLQARIQEERRLLGEAEEKTAAEKAAGSEREQQLKQQLEAVKSDRDSETNRLLGEIAHLKSASDDALAEKAAELGRLTTEHTDLQTRLNVLDAESQDEIARLKGKLAELEPLTGGLENQDTRFKRFTDRVRLLGTNKHTVMGRLYAQLKERGQPGGVANADAIEKYETQLRLLEDSLNSLEAEKLETQTRLDTQRTEMDQLALAIKEKDQSIEIAEKLLRDMRSSATSNTGDRADWNAKMDALKMEKDAQIDRLRREIAELMKSSQAANAVATDEARAQQNSLDFPPPVQPSASRQTPQATGDNDDLKKIHGIGPVMERMLNELGITHYRQIAAFTREDIERVATEIDTFPGRIDRDDWLGGAKKAHFAKYGETI